MQIIPQNIFTEPMPLSGAKKKPVTSFSLQSFTAYIPKSISTPDILTKNQDMVQKNKKIISIDSLSQEETIRLRNELLDKKKITQKEADSISYMLTFQGPHSLESIIESISEAEKGLHSLSPEEYMEVQKLLQGLDLSQENIAQFTEYMNSSSYKEAWSLLSSLQKTEHKELFTQSLPLLKKLFLGESKSANPLLDESISLSDEEAENIVEEIINALSSYSSNPKEINERIAQEIEILSKEREKFSALLEHSSEKESAFVQAERFSRIHTMTKESNSAFLNSFTTEELSFNENNNKYTSLEEFFPPQDTDSQKDSPENMFSQNEHNSTKFFASKNTEKLSSSSTLNSPFKNELQNNILNLVENGFVEMKGAAATSLLLQVKPEALGSIMLSLQFQDGKISALLKSENNDVTKLLEKSIPSLTKSLEEQGIKVDSLIVAQKDETYSQDQNFYNNFFQNNHEQNAKQNAKEALRIGRLRSILQTLQSEKNSNIKTSSSSGLLNKIV